MKMIFSTVSKISRLKLISQLVPCHFVFIIIYNFKLYWVGNKQRRIYLYSSNGGSEGVEEVELETNSSDEEDEEDESDDDEEVHTFYLGPRDVDPYHYRFLDLE